VQGGVLEGGFFDWQDFVGVSVLWPLVGVSAPLGWCICRNIYFNFYLFIILYFSLIQPV
jgi:hypothetical protein